MGYRGGLKRKQRLLPASIPPDEVYLSPQCAKFKVAPNKPSLLKKNSWEMVLLFAGVWWAEQGALGLPFFSASRGRLPSSVDRGPVPTSGSWRSVPSTPGRGLVFCRAPKGGSRSISGAPPPGVRPMWGFRGAARGGWALLCLVSLEVGSQCGFLGSHDRNV